MTIDTWWMISLCLAPFASLGTALLVVRLARRRCASKRVTYFIAAIASGIVLVVLLFSTRVVEAVTSSEASAGAHSTLGQLPHIDGVELVTVQDTSFLSDIGNCCCAFGRLWLIFGTSLPLRETLDQYAQKLESLGWNIQGDPAEYDRVFVHGSHELINLYYGGDGGDVWDYGKHPDYLAAKSKYPNLLEARIDYLVPSRIECGYH
jgi:hypothetical protein